MDLIIGTDKRFKIKEGEDIHETLKRNDIHLVSSCGGNGTCGKCRVRILAGKYKVISYGKLDKKDRQKGIVLACLTIPESNTLIEIPKESKLVVGDKIAISKSKNLVHYLKSYNVSIDPIIKKIYLELTPPNLNDNRSDLERLKKALSKKSIKNIHLSHGFTSTISEIMRNADWKVELSYIEKDDYIEASSLISPEEGNRRYGIAVDIGTTTVVVYLVDLLSGDIVDIGSTYNSQMRHGDDVITRIVYATEGAGLEELRDEVITDINTLIDSLKEKHHIISYEIESAVIAANTTMSHIFWGINPEYIREEPYIPTYNYFPLWRGKTARLSICPQSYVYTVPCIGSYVGGDVVAGVLVSKMYKKPEIALFMDIGTNGEIVIGNNEWLITAACSAGPCFEGGGIKHGMRATEGAIEGIKFYKNIKEPELFVIGNTKPVGICGTGMISAISEMFLNGIINQKGKFVRDINSERIREGEDGMEYIFHCDTIKDIVLTEVDLENIIRAKAAIYAGVSLLLKEAGLTFDVIEKVYIAGGFGNYLNIEKAIILGMLPDMPKEKFVFLGNSSIMGAYLCLLSGKLRMEVEDIASKMTYIELSVMGTYMEEYMSAMFLPHTDITRFPSVQNLFGQNKTLIHSDF